MTSRRQIVLAAPALAATAFAGGARAQTSYPERLVKIVVGNAPGGNDDTIGRNDMGRSLLPKQGRPRRGRAVSGIRDLS